MRDLLTRATRAPLWWPATIAICATCRYAFLRAPGAGRPRQYCTTTCGQTTRMQRYRERRRCGVPLNEAMSQRARGRA